MAGPRRRSREIALQILHQIDVGGAPERGVELDVDVMVARYFEHMLSHDGPAGEEEGYEGFASSSELSPARIDRPLVEQLVRGVCEHRQELDDQLTALSQNWRIERIGIVERNVIRIALFELKYCENVPFNVVLNEAVELAKRYGTAEGAAFANGLLDKAVGELGIRR
jgi:transcription antitermination protein NusB